MGITANIQNQMLLGQWNIQNSNFDNDFKLVYFPSEKTIPSFTITDITLATNVTLKQTNLFQILGSVSSDEFVVEKIKILDSVLGEESANDGSFFLFQGAYNNLKIRNIEFR